MGKIALLAGSTGLIGGQLLELLLADDYYTSVVAVSRKPLGISNPKLTNIVCELHELSAALAKVNANDVFCCLGTIMRIAKTKEAFRAVDYDAPLALAQIAKQNGATSYLIVSALGANKDSSIFYNKVKGEVEEAIASVGFSSYHILRPSLLKGSRIEYRSGEEAAHVFYKLVGFLIPRKYASIESLKVARAMVSLASKQISGTVIHESLELQMF
jgi:uncharacterized protein YbjT (DUF2867 family)